MKCTSLQCSAWRIRAKNRFSVAVLETPLISGYLTLNESHISKNTTRQITRLTFVHKIYT